MFKSNKKNVLEFKRKNNTSLLTSNSKEEENKIRIEKIKQRVVLKKNKDINGMEITHSIIKKKIKSLFNVDYNKSAKSCNPCMNACKKVNNKINGRKLSAVSNNEMKEIMKVFPS